MKDRLQGVGRLAKAGVAILLMMVGAQAMAANKGAAASTTLENIASATYTSAASATPITATSNAVIITINLVPAFPTVAFTSSTPTDLLNLVEGQTATLTYTLTSNANGPDDYTVVVGEASVVNITGTVATEAAAITLGGSTVALDSTIIATCLAGAGSPSNCLITLPNDSSAGTGGVNGLDLGDTVVFEGGRVCTIAPAGTLTDTGGLTSLGGTLSSIEVTGCSGAIGTIVAGTSVYEQATQTVAVLIDVTSLGAPGTATLQVTAIVDGSPAITSAALTDLPVAAYVIDLTISKFVRNVTESGLNPACGLTALSCLNVDGVLYYASGVTANPTNILEYAILASNNGGPVTEIIVTDDLTAFSSFNGATGTSTILVETTAANNSSGLCTAVGGTTDGTQGTCILSAGTPIAATIATDVTGDTITVSAGDNGSNGGTNSGVVTGQAGGELAVGKVSVVLFQVEVD
ncbi:MAG: hypothetical protein HQ497_02660 [SAR86 cluster bacterium]|uniref:DUF11 domain-containing protein n=1 Tax=SAR86 cluster bacterium TaxID=2030880 RepID=A0A973A809_9GAMM|nr:hypothetical protein [SAR86 cluster bacterium]